VSASHDRARALEKKAAAMLRTERVKYRPRFKSAPDMLPVTLPSGAKIQGEAKRRKTIPAYVREGLDQCRRYTPDAVPCVVIEQSRGEPIACVPLALLVQLLGIAPLELPAQPSLPLADKAKANP
jgi:hypothetical protein